MNWKKLSLNNTTNAVLLICQNSSILANSKVYISVTSANTANPANAFLLTGPNQLRLTINVGDNVFYVEDGGGIFTHVSGPIEKLVNYDIPTTHVDVNATNQVIAVPEGAYFTIQNKGEEPLRFGIQNQGVFVLTQNQMLSYTFMKNTNIRLSGTGQPCSYLISQSSNVTKLSDKIQTLLDEMKATVNILAGNSATQTQLQEIEKKTWFGRWSEDIIKPATTGTKYESPVFGANKDIHSEFMRSSNDVLDVVQELQISWDNFGVVQQETAFIRYSLFVKESGTSPIMGWYCDNMWVNKWIDHVDLTMDMINQLIKVDLVFNAEFLSINGTTKVRADNTAFKHETTVAIQPQKNSQYSINKMNTDIFFEDQDIINRILNQWDVYGTRTVFAYEEWRKVITDTTDKTEVMFFMNQNTHVTFTFWKDESKAEMILTIPQIEKTDKVFGLNLRPKRDVDKSGLYMDLVVLGNSKAVRSSNGTNHVYTLPLYKHSVTGFKHIVDALQITDTVTQSKYNYTLELVLKTIS